VPGSRTSGLAESGYSWKPGRFLIEGTLLDPGAVVLTREALPLDGNHGGGLDEDIIPHGVENGAIRVDNGSGVNLDF
jgi:hypothetical protein